MTGIMGIEKWPSPWTRSWSERAGQPCESPAIPGEELIAGLDQGLYDREAPQPRQWPERRDFLEGAQHCLTARGPSAACVDDVESPREIALDGQAPDLGSVAGSHLVRHQAQAPRRIEAGQPTRDARAHRAVTVVQDGQRMRDHVGSVSHDGG